MLAADRQRILESYLGLALTYYYFAVLSSRRRLDEAVISLFIAAEALLITESKLVSRMLSRRLSALIAENETERSEIRKKIRELYKLRSAIVHGGGKKPSPTDASILFKYVRRAIELGLSLRCLSKEDLVVELDNKYPEEE